MFDLQRLRALHAVRQHGSVAAAADALGFTPSAVSQQIGKLEREVRSPLLERAGRGVILTDAGLVLADATDSILTTTEQASADLEELRSGVAGTLRVLCFPTAIRGLVGPALGELRRTTPDLTVLMEETWIRTTERIEAGHADLAIAHDWVDSPIDLPAHLSQAPLMEDPVDVLLPAEHPLAGRDDVLIDDLLDAPWIIDTNDGSICSQWLRSQMAARGRIPDIVHRVDEYPSQIAVVAAGLGVSTLPRLGRPDLPSTVRTVPLRGERPVRRVFTVCRRASSRRPAIRTLIDALRARADHP
ncbi:LysR family transcriptional regulator [Luteipulveratus flavus]|uniref:LysR substrate-binding domain-containing protein n=1 Tax=Luteipulveratus flavus TaxID=3031728 RepID=A0ABT6CBR6_9MICO|nr:LysR family transcriptional regulator [Luteipulveratus sp. YIM 133296]MDF8265933.1 LysR substrate-binding domain-containing protein [Luteipulveratus sp. YIM 133296]